MQDPLTDPLARELAKLIPATTAVTPASVLFAAGVQSAEHKARLWQKATAGMVVIFVGSWVGMTLRPDAGNHQNNPMASANPPSHAGSVPEVKNDPKVEKPQNERVTPDSKPTPGMILVEKIDDDTLEMRAKGIRLRNDILAGGLGMIPDRPKVERPHVPYGSLELNPTVLGGHYAPKKDEPQR